MQLIWREAWEHHGKFSGGCACGAIRYETDDDPVVMLNCHCRDCRASGSAYAAGRKSGRPLQV